MAFVLSLSVPGSFFLFLWSTNYWIRVHPKYFIWIWYICKDPITKYYLGLQSIFLEDTIQRITVALVEQFLQSGALSVRYLWWWVTSEEDFTPQFQKEKWPTEAPLKMESTVTQPPKGEMSHSRIHQIILLLIYPQNILAHLGPFGDGMGGLPYSDFSSVNKASLTCVFAEV